MAGSLGVVAPLLRLVLEAIESLAFPPSDIKPLDLLAIESSGLSSRAKDPLVFRVSFAKDSLILSCSFFLFAALSTTFSAASVLFLLALSGSAAAVLLVFLFVFFFWVPSEGGAFSSSSSSPSSSLLLKLGGPASWVEVSGK